MLLQRMDSMPDTTSLSEARRALLERHLRGELPPTTKTVDDTTSGTPASTASPRAGMVAVQIGGARRPFFFLHGDYKGGAFYCFPLAQHLGSDQPFYALDPYRFDSLLIPPSLEDMAAAHIECLRTVQAQGPYLLGGFCNGAVVAYEMARQLHAAGQSVDLLVLMDPPPFAFLKRMHDLVKRLGNLLRLDHERQLYWFLWLRHLYRYVQHLYRYLRFPSYRDLKNGLTTEQMEQEGGAVLALKALHERNLVQNAQRRENHEQPEPERQRAKGSFAFASLRWGAIFPEAIFPTSVALSHDYPGIFYWATADYMPDHYPGESTFFFFRESQGVVRRSLKWRKLARAKDKEVTIHVLVGTHDTCKTTHLRDLTERLRMCLSKAQGPDDPDAAILL